MFKAHMAAEAEDRSRSTNELFNAAQQGLPHTIKLLNKLKASLQNSADGVER